MNFGDYPGFQLFFTQGKYFCPECSLNVKQMEVSMSKKVSTAGNENGLKQSFEDLD